MPTTVSLEAFENLTDRAVLRIVPIAGGLTQEKGEAFLAVLDQLLEQWKESGKVTAGTAVLAANGKFVMIAYDLAGADLSGCTKDQLTHALLDYERVLKTPMLNAPRIAVERNGEVDFMNNIQFKELRAAGEVDAGTRVYDHLIATLGELRDGKFETTVGESWYDRVGKPS